VDKRTPIPRRLRFEILRRDGYTCRYCGASAPDMPLTVDHVIPVALGGADEPANLVTACKDCNAGKTSTSPSEGIVEDVAADALRWAKAMEAATQLHRMDRQLADGVLDRFRTTWNQWTHEHVVKEGKHVYTAGKGMVHKGRVTERRTFELPSDWRGSIDRLVVAGLPPETFRRLIDLALGGNRVKDRFRFFCGCAWNIVSDLQEQARRLVENDEVR